MGFRPSNITTSKTRTTLRPNNGGDLGKDSIGQHRWGVINGYNVEIQDSKFTSICIKDFPKGLAEVKINLSFEKNTSGC